MSEILGRTIGDFRILSKIGQGAMGTVYLAEQPALKRCAAVKILLPELARDREYTKRFKREAMLSASLNHPNIVQVYGAGESDDIHYIAMELVDGESLQRRMLRDGQVKPEDALDIIIRLAEALNHAWQKLHMIHRDIKPSNILISKAGDLKLVDFGLAKSTGGESTLTSSGALLGTPFYISPEQARGDDDVDFTTDMYSLGCTLYHMLCGKAPFNANAPLAVVLQHVTQPMPSILDTLPSCPPALVKLINWLVAKKTAERPASYAKLLEELRRVKEDLSAPPRISRPLLAIGTLVIAGLAFFLVNKWVPSGGGQAGKAPDSAGASSKAVPAQTAETQARHVIEKLKELNPEFDPASASFVIEQDAVAELVLGVAGVRDLSPVRALPSLRRLRLGYPDQKGSLESLSALRGLPLTRLECFNTPVSDLTPLRGMPLTRLILSGSRRLTDLEPLRDCPLEALAINETGVAGLEPLKGLPLQFLNCGFTQVSDLTPLANMRLTDLNCSNSLVRDLHPLVGMALRRLSCDHTSVEDLTPLRGMGLKEISCDFDRERDEEVLRSITTLEKINGLPAARFWRTFGSAKFP